ncbi:MAG: L-threonylcarbamoyladenylate synthase [Desulfosalsimonas sp.]
MRDKAPISRIDVRFPDPAVIGAAAGCIRRGGLVIFPTRSLYGLGADALNPEAVDRVFSAKNRPAKNPVSILIGSPDLLENFVAEISDSAQRIIDRFWPGGITLVFRAVPGLPKNLTANTGTIGIRLPAHPAAAALVRAAGTAVTATSANTSNAPGAGRVSDISDPVARAAHMILDAGPLAAGSGSTILDVTCEPPAVLRQGAVSESRLQQVLPGVRARTKKE